MDDKFVTREECMSMSVRIERMFNDSVHELKKDILDRIDEIKAEFEDFKNETKENNLALMANKVDVALLSKEMANIKEDMEKYDKENIMRSARNTKILLSSFGIIVAIIQIIGQIISRYVK